MNPTFEATCDQCRAPLSEPPPLVSIQPPEPELREKRRPPRTIVLIGIWMVFLPNLLGTAYLAVYVLRHRGGLAEFIIFWGEVGLTCLSFFLLYHVTKNYFFSNE